MNILVLINNFIDEPCILRNLNIQWQEAVITRQIKEFKSYQKYNLDIKRFTTPRGLSFTFDNVETIVHPYELQTNFAYTPKQWIVENKSVLKQYDYVLYTEDDLLIYEEQFHNVIQYQTLLNTYSDNLKVGFIRFEKKADGSVIYNDQHPAHSIHRGGSCSVKQVIMIDNHTFFEPWNIHSGCWLLSSDDIIRMIDNNTFQTSAFNLGRVYVTELESSATEVYFDYTKVYPENFTEVAIEHMCDKYIGVNQEYLMEEIRVCKLQN